MAHSVGELIMQTIADALNAPVNAPRLAVRQRTTPMSLTNPDGTSGLDQFLLYAVKENSERVSQGCVKRERHVRIEIPVSGAPPLDAVADPLYLYIVQTLFASAALMDSISLLEEVGLVWETDSSYEDACVCALELKVTYVTTLDPATAAMQSAGL